MPTKLSRYCDGIMEAAWIAAAILIPLFFDIYSSRIFEPDKITLLRSIALVVLVAWVVKLVDEGRIRHENTQPEEFTLKGILKIPLLAPVLSMAILYIISTIFSVSPRTSLWGSYQRLQGTYTTFSYLIIFFSLIANLRRRAQVERILTVAILTTLPISFYGILQRYHIDPVPWGGDVSTRIASTMGNSIFVAAYLIMVFPVTVGRILQTFQAILHDTEHLTTNVVRGTIYVFAAALQLIAIYMSGSRGPVLGLFVGAFFLFLLLTILWRKRWLTASVVGMAIAFGIFLFIFNIPKGPLDKLRTSPAIGRFGLLVNADSNSALVRKYIWEGVVKLVSLHPPIQYPDGSTDRFNFLRPLIGYGPESMYVAFNPFYVPALGQVEKRNASPDRSHNETWDSLAITGVLGLVIYLSLFVSVFYFGLKWLGLIPDRRSRILFFVLCLGSGVIGAIGVMIWRGVEYFGVGLPFGMVFGIVLYLILIAIFAPYQPEKNEVEAWRYLAITILLTAIISHFVEINFGIAIVATRTYFWTYSALIFVIGYLMPRVMVREPAAISVEKSREQVRKESRRNASKFVRSRHKKEETSSQELFGLAVWKREALVGAGIVALFLITLGFNFISNPSQSTSTLGIIWNSMTQLPNHNNASSYGILALFLFTWLVAPVLWVAESTKENGDENWATSLVLILVVSILLALLFWLWHAADLVSIAANTPSDIQGVFAQVDRVGGVLTAFYIYTFLMIFGMALFIPIEWPGRMIGSETLAPAGGFVLILVVIWLVNQTNLRVIHADIAFKMAEPFNRPTQWPVATILYKRANQLAPSEDYYYLFLGRSYLEQAKETTDATQQEQLVNQAEADLKVAQKINPLNTDHTANLARLYSWWASQTTDAAVKQQRAQIASDYYARALTLSPNNSNIWGEWAILNQDVLHQPQKAYEDLTTALSLDQSYNWTQGLMGDYYYKISKTITNTAQKSEDLLQAVDYYKTAYQLTLSSDKTTRIQYLVDLSNSYIDMNRLDDAITTYLQVVSLNPDANTLWKIQETLAQLYSQKGDKANALLYAQDALAGAPSDQTSRLQALVDKVKTMP